MKKFLLLTLLTLCLAAFAACGEDSPEPAGPGGLRMDRIIMGTNAAFPPFEFVADYGQGRHGQYSGIDVAIGLRIAEALGAELVIHDAEFAGLIMDLQVGTIDFIAAAMTIRPDRMNQVHFSIPYYTAVQYIVVPIDDTSISSAADLDGKIIGVQLGTTGEFFVQENVDYGSLLPFSMVTPAFIDMMAGGLDAIVIDSAVARMYVNQFPDQLRIVRDLAAFESEHYGIAVRQDDLELLAVINAVLTEMIASGEMDEIYAYYYELMS